MLNTASRFNSTCNITRFPTTRKEETHTDFLLSFYHDVSAERNA